MNHLEIDRKKKIVAYWLLIGLMMIIIQIIIGGITRLTGSGLSITEWKPIMGTLPPMNEQDWLDAFDKYKGIAQYKYLNTHFTLSDFKFIYFWEWFHRVWARSLGVVFAIPFIYFLVKKYFSKDMIGPLILLFLLGGLQGLIGWIMVQSGLNDTDLHVSHIRLSVHLMAALVLLIYTFWFALKLLIPTKNKIKNESLFNLLSVTIIILGIQLVYGGFMAGLKAANFAPTWPTINGDWFPATITEQSWINHPINIHFIHRTLAYLLFIIIFFSFFTVRNAAKSQGSILLEKSAKWPLILVSAQILLGIFTVISSLKIIPGHFGIFEFLAEWHQIIAMFLLMSLFYQLYLVQRSASKI